MGNELDLWGKVMNTALSMPGVQVDRDEFLRKELTPYCSAEDLDKAVALRPLNVTTKDVLDKVASSCIGSHTLKVTAISTAAGIPGGFAMAETIPADMAQYYWHVFVVAQKLAYLYGFPDFRDEKGNLTDSAADMLTVFAGVMMGASMAGTAIKGIAKELSKQVMKRLPQQALTKTMFYPIVKEVAKWIGVRMTKEVFAKGIGKAIPIVGGLISGGLTFATFRPSALRLQKKLQEQMDLIASATAGKDALLQSMGQTASEAPDVLKADAAAPVYTPYEEVKETPDAQAAQTPPSAQPAVNQEKLKIMALINLAKIDNDFSVEEEEFVNERIEHSSLSDDDQIELASSLHTPEKFDIDFSLITDESIQAETVEDLYALAMADGKVRLAEKLYLKKVAAAFGLTEEDLKAVETELLNGKEKK